MARRSAAHLPRVRGCAQDEWNRLDDDGAGPGSIRRAGGKQKVQTVISEWPKITATGNISHTPAKVCPSHGGCTKSNSAAGMPNAAMTNGIHSSGSKRAPNTMRSANHHAPM